MENLESTLAHLLIHVYLYARIVALVVALSLSLVPALLKAEHGKMAAPLHRHQSSFEGILNFSSHPPPLETELRSRASRRFHDICQHFDTGIPVDNYSRPRLVRFTYEHSLSPESRDYFLRVFFRAVDLEIGGDEPVSFENVRPKFFQFGDHLFDNFFLLGKALFQLGCYAS